MTESRPQRTARGDGVFPTTRWSIVMGLSERQAFAELCQLYRAPLLVYLARKGYARTDAEDAVQEFFAQLNARPALAPRGPEHGPFRRYLLGAFKHHLTSAYRRRRAQKRGGHVHFESIHERDPRSDADAADHAFESAWAVATLERAMAQVERSYVRDGRGALFGALKRLLDEAGETHADVARELGVSEPTLRVALHRLRKRLAREVRSVVSKTVLNEQDVETEVQYLAHVLWHSRWSLSES